MVLFLKGISTAFHELVVSFLLWHCLQPCLAFNPGSWVTALKWQLSTLNLTLQRMENWNLERLNDLAKVKKMWYRSQFFWSYTLGFTRWDCAICSRIQFCLSSPYFVAGLCHQSVFSEKNMPFILTWSVVFYLDGSYVGFFCHLLHFYDALSIFHE